MSILGSVRQWKLLVWLPVALALMSFGMACGAEATPAPVPPTATATPVPVATPTPMGADKIGGVMRAPVASIAHFDSHQSTAHDLAANAQIHNYLVRFNSDLSAVEPDLASEWTASEDGSTYTFTLHKGVTFHDGRELTCRDVQYSFQRIKTPPEGMRSAYSGIYEAVDTISCPDEHTVVFELSRPSPDILNHFANPYSVVFPRHIAEPNDRAGEYMKTAIGPGTGAYKLKRRVSQEVVVLERNPTYFKDGLPYMDEIQLFEVDEAFTQVTGFQTGRFDWLRNILSAELSRELQRNAAGDWTAVEASQTVVMNFIFEMKDGSPWKGNLELRKAMAKVLCQDDLREVLTDIGFLKWPGGALPLGFPYAMTEDEVRGIPGYGTDCAADRAEGIATLKEGGIVGQDFRIHTLGFFALMNDGAVLVCEQLKAAGMGCSVNALELGAYFELGNNRRMSANDLLAHSIVIRVPTIDGILSHAFHPDGPRNYGDYVDTLLEDKYTAQSQETDPAKREALVKDYQRYFLEQYYHVVLGWRSGSRAWWNYVNGPVASISSSEWWPLVMEDTYLKK